MLAANKRLNTAYVLKEAFGQLWDYGREDLGAALLRQPAAQPPIAAAPRTYERFADTIDRHWDGIAPDCEPESKLSLGLGEGLDNKIRVFQRRADGLREVRLKVVTCMLAPL